MSSFWFISVELLYGSKEWASSLGTLGYMPATAEITKQFMAAKLAGISKLSYCTENTDLNWQQNKFRYTGQFHARSDMESTFNVEAQREYICSMHLALSWLIIWSILSLLRLVCSVKVQLL